MIAARPTRPDAGHGPPIEAVGVATIRTPLAEPIRYGSWVIPFREYAIVRVSDAEGRVGWAVSLTRDGPAAAIVRRSVAPHYVGQPPSDPASLFARALAANPATHAWGVGLRALSLVDVATWDLTARQQGVSITTLLGGTPQPMPATAVVGYPPTASATAVGTQVERLWSAGWRRFKLPIAGTLQQTRERLAAARDAAGAGAWICLDANGIFASAVEAATYARGLGIDLGWLEDPFPATLGAEPVATLRRSIDTPIAVGDEQAGAYFPEALLSIRAVDVVRIDLTCMGGLTRAVRLVHEITSAGALVSPHMYAHVHGPTLAALAPGAPIEWGDPGTGVDPFADSLPQPVVHDGFMDPLPVGIGFGAVIEGSWIQAQEADDPDGILPEA